jgi:5'-deoxynucleotidase YfbR-like HD superfamily hydrolase
MNQTQTPQSPTSLATPQSAHIEAAQQLERAAKHHRHAALLHDAGDARQADIHANIAHVSAAKALADSERAMKLTIW